MAMEADIKITGTVQSAFKHQNTLKGRDGTSPVLWSNHEIEAQRDQYTGLTHGKREHKPFQVALPIDTSFVNIKTAISKNETLSSVMIRYYQSSTQQLTQTGTPGTGGSGEQKPYMTTELKNAVISKVEFKHPNARSVDPIVKNQDMHVVIHFTYMEITTTFTAGGQTYNDAWINTGA